MVPLGNPQPACSSRQVWSQPELQKIWSQLVLQSETLKVAQQVKVLAGKSEDLSLSLGTPMKEEGENQLHKVVL